MNQYRLPRWQKISRGLLPVSESVNIAMQIASGLAAAHARNIVHRDIKPSNVIVTNEKVVKIVDFGLARLASTASATHSITTTGTLPYMAPEQILGEAIDQRSDVWALGVILVQMLTGSHPFLRPNTGAMTFAILNQPPAAIDAVIPLLQPIVLRALSKQPARSYRERWPPPTRPPRRGPWMRANWNNFWRTLQRRAGRARRPLPPGTAPTVTADGSTAPSAR